MKVVVTETDIDVARIEVAGGGEHAKCCRPIAQSLRRRGLHLEVRP